MKTLTRLIFIIGILIWNTSCKNDDDASEETNAQTYWLARYKPNNFIGEDPIIYEEQNILWTFDFDNNILEVEILNNVDHVLLEAGTYSDVISQESSCDNLSRQLIINNVYYGHLFNNNLDDPPTLTLHDICFTERELLFKPI